MSVVVGIDPSLTGAGVAILADGSPTLTKITQPEASGYAARSDRLVNQAAAILSYIAEHPTPDLAVIEGEAFAANNAYTSDGNALWWTLYSTLRFRRIPIAVIVPTTLKLWVTGDGGPKTGKREMVRVIREWWPAHRHLWPQPEPLPRYPKNHDIADAAALAAAGAFHLGDPMPFEVKPRHTANLAAVKWPSISCAKSCAKPDTPQVRAPR